MTETLDIFKCNVCGNIVQVLHSGVGELVCCGVNMEKLIPQDNEGGELAEKHIPTIEKQERGYVIKMDKHPMTLEHYIQFIEVYSKNKKDVHLKFFTPEEVPQLHISDIDDEIEALELCNIHGLWRNKND